MGEDYNMSLVINIYYKGENGNARKFASEMVSSGIAERIRKEEGNLGYEYFFPMNDSEVVLLIDKWKDQESLDVHHKSSMMGEIARLREKYDLHMDVEQFTNIEVSDDNNKFIRK